MTLLYPDRDTGQVAAISTGELASRITSNHSVPGAPPGTGGHAVQR